MQPFIAGGGVGGPYTFTATGLPMAVRGARAGRGGRPRTRNARERLDRFRAIHRVCDVKLARGAPEAAAETRTCLGRRKASSVTVAPSTLAVVLVPVARSRKPRLRHVEPIPGAPDTQSAPTRRAGCRRRRSPHRVQQQPARRGGVGAASGLIFAANCWRLSPQVSTKRESWLE